MTDGPIINPDKCCIECQYMYLNTGSRGYSELTPGDEFSMSCEKQHWDWEPYGSEQQYRDCILAAKRCADFEERR